MHFGQNNAANRRTHNNWEKKTHTLRKRRKRRKWRHQKGKQKRQTEGIAKQHSVYYWMHARLANMIRAHDMAKYQKSNSMKQWKMRSTFYFIRAHKIILFSPYFSEIRALSLPLVSLHYFFCCFHFILHKPMRFIQFSHFWVMHTYASTVSFLFFDTDPIRMSLAWMFFCAAADANVDDAAAIYSMFWLLLFMQCTINRSTRWKSIEKIYLIYTWKLNKKVGIEDRYALVMLLHNLKILLMREEKWKWKK